jgi:hypothetical protein
MGGAFMVSSDVLDEHASRQGPEGLGTDIS